MTGPNKPPSDILEDSRFGEPGDLLYVREAFQPLFADGVVYGSDADYTTGAGYKINYVATDGRVEYFDEDEGLLDRIKPGIHMPRWACRLVLRRVGEVRVERVESISDADVLAEGFDLGRTGCTGEEPWLKTYEADCRAAFLKTIYDINPPKGANPWVWVIPFEVAAKTHAEAQKLIGGAS